MEKLQCFFHTFWFFKVHTYLHSRYLYDLHYTKAQVELLLHSVTAGGSHLPDLTVITPVFYEGIAHPVFFVANRGHHADIGGISPGSMPPHSNYLW